MTDLLCGWLALSLIGGCANVQSPKSNLGQLPTLPVTRMADHSVELEITFADVPDDSEWSKGVWSELDEQILPPDRRRNVSRNGFRVGVVGLQLPEKLREQLDLKGRMGMRGILSDMSPGDQSVTTSRRIQLQSGNRSDIVTRSSQPSLVVLADDGEQVIGKTYHDAQTAFSLRAFVLPDGRVRLELTPEVRFGPTRQRWSTGEGNMFQVESGQDRKSYKRNTIEVELNPGQTLVVAANGASRSLGGNFFAKQVDGQQEKALLIRFAQSNCDDMAGLMDPGFDPIDEATIDGGPESAAIETFEEGLTTQLD